MNKLSVDQVRYLREVLGIEGVLLSQAGETESAEAPQAAVKLASPGLLASVMATDLRVAGDLHACRLIVLASAQGPAHALDGEAGDLARKMIQAMKIKENDVCFIEWRPANLTAPFEVIEWLDSAECPHVLVFGAQTFLALTGHEATLGLMETWRQRSLLATYSPDELLVSPMRKRDAWAHLQILMGRL